jgi:probable HAF family extracellular repeat protein
MRVVDSVNKPDPEKLKHLRGAKVLLAVAAMLAMAHAARANLYAVSDLGILTDLPGRTEATVGGINSSGKVVCNSVANGSYAAMLYGGVWTNLGTLGGADSFGYGVNDSVQVVGNSTSAAGLMRAFLWTPGGTDGVPANPQMKDLGTLGGPSSKAFAINNSGQVAGYAETSRNDYRAFRYSGGTMNDIGALLENRLPNSYGYSINDAGHVAGEARDSQWNLNSMSAFLYNGATAVTLGTLPGGQYASALALNDADQAVGYSDTAAGLEHAFLYAGGVMSDLGTLGGNYSCAHAINNSNVIVGVAGIDPGDDNLNRAFIYAGGSMVDLNTLLDASGTGWTLVQASDINDAGQIVGFGIYGGTNHGFLLDPLPPMSQRPTVTAVQLQEADVLLSFTTQDAAHYAIDCCQILTSGPWDVAMTGITGTGGVVTVTNSGGATVPTRFYRVRLTLP